MFVIKAFWYNLCLHCLIFTKCCWLCCVHIIRIKVFSLLASVTKAWLFNLPWHRLAFRYCCEWHPKKLVWDIFLFKCHLCISENYTFRSSLFFIRVLIHWSPCFSMTLKELVRFIRIGKEIRQLFFFVCVWKLSITNKFTSYRSIICCIFVQWEIRDKRHVTLIILC